MKPVEFHPEAMLELESAIGYYEQCVPGLGYDLEKDVKAGLQKIQAAPLRWLAGARRTRRFLLRRFPDRIVFLEHTEKILIIAFAQGKQHPGYWHERI